MRRVNKVPGAHPGLTFMCGVSHRIHVVETRTDGIVLKVMVFTMHTARYVDMNNCKRMFRLVDPIDLQCNPFDTHLVIHQVESIHGSTKVQACACHCCQTKKKVGSNLQIRTVSCPRLAQQLVCSSPEASTRKNWIQEQQQEEENLHHSQK